MAEYIWKYEREWLGWKLALIGYKDHVSLEVNGQVHTFLRGPVKLIGGKGAEEENEGEGTRPRRGATADSGDGVRGG